MNRQQEYWELLRQLNQLPPELDGTVDRARARARRSRRGRRWGISLASLAGMCASFVIAVNALPTFALACGKVPVLRELAAAVAFSPSLSAAVEHDYVQYIGQSAQVDGVTVSLEYLIADQQQIVVFYRLEGAEEECYLACTLKDEAGEKLTGYSVIGGPGGEELNRLEIHCKELEVPDTLRMELTLVEAPTGSGERRERGTISFLVGLDPAKTAPAVTIPVDRWVEVDGQRLLVEKLEITPTKTTLYLDDDGDNTAWLVGLKCYLTDGGGTVYGREGNTLTATGRVESKGFYTYYLQSLYYAEDLEHLTLHIDGAIWLDKEAERLTLNLTDGSYTGTLPDCVGSMAVQEQGGTVILVESVEDLSPLELTFYDPEGGAHRFNGSGMSGDWTDENGVYHPFQHDYRLEDYPWDTVELEWSYTAVIELKAPMEVPLG